MSPGRSATELKFPPEYFEREDETDDSLFYSFPRLVVHIDEQAIEAVGRVFRDLIPPGSVVLDLLSSWRSHWPRGHPKRRMVGLGLNAPEMQDNPDLDEYVVHDLNRDPALPFPDDSFDAVVITVSAQYLTRPVETFQHVNRILKPGAVFIVTLSNRMFPTKAVRAWRMSSDRGRMELVAGYMAAAGNFEEIKGGFVNPETSPPGDPIFSVIGRKPKAPHLSERTGHGPAGLELTQPRGWPKWEIPSRVLPARYGNSYAGLVPVRGGSSMTQSKHYWTNSSVVALAEGKDPVEVIVQKARTIILDAVEKGWSGPPFDPFRLAEELKISVIPRDDVLDARLVPSGSRGRIEFNPNRPPGRIRFSLAHEIAHTLFPDYAAAIRRRGESLGDAWQIELLCNLAAAEFLMPIGTAIELESESVDIDNLMRLRRQFDVSTEALFLRMVRLTNESCAIFAAARIANGGGPPNFRIDYTAPSRSWGLDIPQGLQVSGSLAIAECTAVGYTTNRFEKWTRSLPEFAVECVGIAPYPGDRYPRVMGVLRRRHGIAPAAPRFTFVHGDATEPRGPGRRMIAHIVNDKTPNWGAGFARQVRMKWPYVQDDFKLWANEDERNLALGNTHVTSVSEDLNIVHMVAQHGYGPSPKPRIRYTALRRCLEHLAELALKQGATVHMPRIGSGQAGGHWGIISELIDGALVRNGIEVTVYDLPEAEPPKEVQGLLGLGATYRQVVK